LDDLAFVQFPWVVFPLGDIFKRWKREPHFVRSSPAIGFATAHASDKETLWREALPKGAKLLIRDRQLRQDNSVDSAELALALGVQGFDECGQILGLDLRVMSKGEETEILGQPGCRVCGLVKLIDQHFKWPGDQQQVHRVALKKRAGLPSGRNLTGVAKGQV
jgi:hypothetical protein